MSLNITVLGVGGCGCNCIERILESKSFDEIKNIEFCVADTDFQRLSCSLAKTKVRLGKKTTVESDCNRNSNSNSFFQRILQFFEKTTVESGSNIGEKSGSNGDVNIGEKSAIESKKDIAELLKNTDILLVIAGLAGGTGAGATPVIIETAKELGIIPIAVIIEPFSFEGRKRKRIAKSGFDKIEKLVKFGVKVSNDKLIELAGEELDVNDLTFDETYSLVDGEVNIPLIKYVIDLSSKMSSKNDFSESCKDLTLVS